MKFEGGFDSLGSVVGSPLLGASCLPLYVPMEGIRKLLTIDKEKRTATKVADITAFWDVLAQGVADAWGNADVSRRYASQ